jgi:hypothetical protein
MIYLNINSNWYHQHYIIISIGFIQDIFFASHEYVIYINDSLPYFVRYIFFKSKHAMSPVSISYFLSFKSKVCTMTTQKKFEWFLFSSINNTTIHAFRFKIRIVLLQCRRTDFIILMFVVGLKYHV